MQNKRVDLYPVNYSAFGKEDVAPQGFVSLMDLYENNYLRLAKLIPNIKRLSNSHIVSGNTLLISEITGCLSLYLSIIESTKFTLTLHLSYHFLECNQVIAEPDLTLRVYFDAQQVEVLTGHLQHGKKQYNYVNPQARKLKWKLNRFLYKWLGYSLHLGHRFVITPTDKQKNKALEPRLRKSNRLKRV